VLGEYVATKNFSLKMKKIRKGVESLANTTFMNSVR
jgi:hypothetical protein